MKSDGDVENDQEAPSQRFKHLSLELIDIGLFTSQKGLEYVQNSAPYKATDPYLHFEERAKQVLQGSEKLYRLINDQVYVPLKD